MPAITKEEDIGILKFARVKRRGKRKRGENNQVGKRVRRTHKGKENFVKPVGQARMENINGLKSWVGGGGEGDPERAMSYWRVAKALGNFENFIITREKRRD